MLEGQLVAGRELDRGNGVRLPTCSPLTLWRPREPSH